MSKNILVIGAGYVGLANAITLARKNKVTIYDLNKSKIKDLKCKNLPLAEKDAIKEYKNNFKNLSFTDSFPGKIHLFKFILICISTNFKNSYSSFDTSGIESLLLKFSELNAKGLIIIRSTLPIGFTAKAKTNFPKLNIIFMPEFLREGFAITDSINPERIVFGGEKKFSKQFLTLIKNVLPINKTSILFTDEITAEGIKLFANTYLAMRVSFFNELDSFAWENKLISKDLIDGICLDKRIGNDYNNPSFGYGGYCLPKDTKQLQAQFENIPNSLIKSISKSNTLRKEFIVKKILERNPKKIGIFKLEMKKNSENSRESAIIDIIKLLKKASLKIYIYEDSIIKNNINDIQQVTDLNKFCKTVDVIICNRYDRRLKKFNSKVITRDIFNNW